MNKTLYIFVTFSLLSVGAVIVTLLTGAAYELNFATIAAMYAVIQNIYE